MLRPVEWYFGEDAARLFAMMFRALLYTYSSWHRYDDAEIGFVRAGWMSADELIRKPRHGLVTHALLAAKLPRRQWERAEEVAVEIRAVRTAFRAVP